jgi:hypothetical protein
MSLSEVGWWRLTVAWLIGVSLLVAPIALDPLIRTCWPWLVAWAVGRMP